MGDNGEAWKRRVCVVVGMALGGKGERAGGEVGEGSDGHFREEGA